MSLRNTMQRAFRGLHVALGDTSETVTYRAFTSGDYTPSTADVTRNEKGKTVEGVIFSNYADEQIDGQEVLRSDRKVTIPSLNLGTTTPTQNDRVIRANGETWEVQRAHVDSFGACWVLQVRK